MTTSLLTTKGFQIRFKKAVQPSQCLCIHAFHVQVDEGSTESDSTHNGVILVRNLDSDVAALSYHRHDV